MIALPKKAGNALATLVQRVQDEAYEDENARLRDQIEQLKAMIRTAEERVEYWRNAANAHVSVAPIRSSWVVASDYCRTHNISATYLNRALNKKEGYKLDVDGKKSATGRWLVNTAAIFTHTKKARAKKPA